MILSFDQLEEWNWKPYFVILLRNITDVIKNLKDTSTMVEFLALAIRKQKFLSIVQKIQSYVTISIVSNAFESSSIEHALRVLDIFNAANE